MLAQYLIKVGLGMPDRTVDHTAVVAPFAGFVVAAEVHAHQPPVPSPSHDLSRLTRQTQILPKNLAHHWHTGAGCDRSNSMNLGEKGTEGESVSSGTKACNKDESPLHNSHTGWPKTPAKPQFSTDS